MSVGTNSIQASQCSCILMGCRSLSAPCEHWLGCLSSGIDGSLKHLTRGVNQWFWTGGVSGPASMTCNIKENKLNLPRRLHPSKHFRDPGLTWALPPPAVVGGITWNNVHTFKKTTPPQDLTRISSLVQRHFTWVIVWLLNSWVAAVQSLPLWIWFS